MPVRKHHDDLDYTMLAEGLASVLATLQDRDPLMRLAILGAAVNLTLHKLPADERQQVMEDWISNVRKY